MQNTQRIIDSSINEQEQGVNQSILLDEHEKIISNDNIKNQSQWSQLINLGMSSLQSSLGFSLDMSLTVISLFFLGNYNESRYVAAYGFASNIYVFISTSIGYSIASSLESLSSQAYGAGQYVLIGQYYNKILVISAAVITLDVIIYLLAPFWLIYLDINQDLLEDTIIYLRYVIPTVFSLFYTDILLGQLNAMNIYHINAKLSIIKFASNIILNIIIIVYFKQGFTGAIITKNLVELISVTYLVYTTNQHGYFKLFRQPLQGSFNNWGLFLKNAIIRAIVPHIDWITIILFPLYAGFLKDINSTTAQSSLSSVFDIYLSFMFGYEIVVTTLISNALGNCNQPKIKQHITTAFIYFIIQCIIFSTLFSLFLPYLSQFVLGDDSIQYIIESVQDILLFEVIVAAYYNWIIGVLKGLNKYESVTLISIISAIFSHSTCLYLVFVLDYGLRGIWIGLIIFKGLNSFICTFQLLSTSIQKEIDNVQDRLNLENQS